MSLLTSPGFAGAESALREPNLEPDPEPEPAGNTAPGSGGEGADPRRTRSLSIGLVDLATRLRKKPETIFDVVIVGSGYGASVAAQQLAGLESSKGSVSICVLERGAEYLPGMFPSALGDMPAHTRFSAQASGRVMGNREGLFDLRLGADVSALVASGLGGGSLINAGVLLEPDGPSLHASLPPTAATDLEKKFLAEAKHLLLGSPPPGGSHTITGSPMYRNKGYPLKFHRLQDLGTGQPAGDKLVSRPAVMSVAMRARNPDAHSVDLNACNGCGDCMTGCNVGAKASLDTNLLAQAKKAGAELVTGAAVLSLARVAGAVRPPGGASAPLEAIDAGESDDAGGFWELDVVHTSPALQRREASPLKIKARRVILAAGALGSPEILLRSRNERLSFSSRLGEKFSCNGDNIAAVHRLPADAPSPAGPGTQGLEQSALKPAHSTADENQALGARQVGPTITNLLQVPAAGERKDFWIQEFAVPAPLKRLFAEVVTTGRVLADLQKADMSGHGAETDGDTDPCAVDDAAVESTLMVGLIGHDSAEGSLHLPLPQVLDRLEQHQEGSIQIVWPQARHGMQLHAAHKKLEDLCGKAFPGATVIANPLWRLLPETLEDLVSQPLGPVLTVHPLGGCAMGTDATLGVVNEFGEVFNAAGASPTEVFDGLVVLDGSVIGGSLGANPLLTIAALALRAVGHLQTRWGFEEFAEPACLERRPVAAAAQPTYTVPPIDTKVGVVERLWGHVELQITSLQAAPFLFELTLAYQPVGLRSLMKLWGGRELQVDENRSYLRLYDSGAWDPQTRRFASDLRRFKTDDERVKDVVLEARLSGRLKFLAREKSSGLGRCRRALWAFLQNRGKRDIWQELTAFFKGTRTLSAWAPTVQKGLFAGAFALMGRIIDAVKLATRAGEVRRLNYALNLGEVRLVRAGAVADALAAALPGKQVLGEKRLTYNRRGNPWAQLTTLELTGFAPLTKRSNRRLRLDAQYMVQTNLPLIELTAQQNKVNSLLDMASFGLFVTRIMLQIHLWSFRKPDAAQPRIVQRLPGALPGLPPPELTHLTVGHHRKTDEPITVRLARYRPAAGASVGALPPLVMIHGYSASGTTFAHPSLQPSAARYFCDQGREVWVIDLRTSAGMPTAIQPWAMEEVALIDIPAALLHIKNVTGQRVDVVAHCIGAAMLGMALLTDARAIRNATVQLGVDTWIPAPQLGVLTAFNGAGGAGKPHPTVNSVVLSQKGPLLRYTEENIFRAHLMRGLRRWLVPDGYQFEAKADPGLADQLLDRLLASLHYEDAEFDVENPPGFSSRTPWTAARHRIDALFGRVFAARNLSCETLEAIDDFFGPVNIDTVSQTIHFVRFSCITNQRGRGEFVTLANLRSRWSGIPTLSLHGAGNGLADVSTQSLLHTNFAAAGIALSQEVYPDLEHQDMWIGRTSERVFGDIENFLKTKKSRGQNRPARTAPAANQAGGAATSAWHFELPWIGPRLSVEQGAVVLHALSSPRFGVARLVLVPVGVGAAPAAFARCGALLPSVDGDSRNWVTVGLTRSLVEPPNELPLGWFAVMAYDRDQTTLSEADTAIAVAHPPGNGVQTNAALDAAGLLPNQPLVEPDPTGLVAALDAWLAVSPPDLELALVRTVHVQRQLKSPPETFEFALGSCRYPAGLPDQKLAEFALNQLAAECDRLSFAIFCGDQIYADATAGAMDPTRRDERYDLPYEMAFRAAPMRSIARAMPIYTLLDDHEMVDNWEPSAPTSRRAARKEGKLRGQALNAFFKYQRMQSKPAARGAARERRTSMQFDHGCASFFFLDTRSQRQYRKPGNPNANGLFAVGERALLEAWLIAKPDRVRFIVTPALVLPRRLGALNSGPNHANRADHAARSDGWEGYPGDLQALLAFIAIKEIENVVFLSGDEHLGCVAIADLSGVKPCGGVARARIVSIHASGLYAPFPFANSRAQDFVQGIDCFSVGAVQCIATARFTPPGSLYARLRVQIRGGTPSVGFKFCGAGQGLEFDNLLSADAPAWFQHQSQSQPQPAVVAAIPTAAAR
ncbi:MAG: alkaline phosphatase D family protein [Polaromonas sp.]|nr:alkaline phosphatase D family protein [Polaromonas sp.]